MCNNMTTPVLTFLVTVDFYWDSGYSFSIVALAHFPSEKRAFAIMPVGLSLIGSSYWSLTSMNARGDGSPRSCIRIKC